MVRQAVGPAVQVGVGDDGALALERHGIGPGVNGLLEELVEPERPGRRCGSLVAGSSPTAQEAPSVPALGTEVRHAPEGDT